MYDLLGNPTGEKDKSTSPNDAVVVRKADIVFKVIIIIFYVAENPTGPPCLSPGLNDISFKKYKKTLICFIMASVQGLSCLIDF